MKIFSLLFLLILGGCGHTARHGTIAMKENDTLVHVSIHDVKVGDKVVLFHNLCEPRGERGGARTCRRQEIAPGVVKNVFSEHYSLVEFPPGTRLVEGDFVETIAK